MKFGKWSIHVSSDDTTHIVILENGLWYGVENLPQTGNIFLLGKAVLTGVTSVEMTYLGILATFTITKI